MSGRNSIVKNTNATQKISPENSLPLPWNRKKKREHFAQLWRQWLFTQS